jgi:hypothetical protein
MSGGPFPRGVSWSEEGPDILGASPPDIHALQSRRASHDDCFRLVDFAVGVVSDLAGPQAASLSAGLGLPAELGLSLIGKVLAAPAPLALLHHRHSLHLFA